VGVGWLLAVALALGAAADAQAPAPHAPAGAEPAAADKTPLAALDGRVLTRKDVEGAVAFRIYQHEVDIYSLLRAETERRVDEILLAREAERRGTTPEALLGEIEGKAPPVAEAEIDAYLAEHPADAAAPAAEVRVRVRHYLSETRRIQRRLDFVAGLRRAAGYRFLLEPPAPPRTEVDVAGAPARGPADAAVVIVHFASFGSEPSARSATAIARVAAEFPGRVRQIHRNLMREGDERGLLAARLALEAQDRGRFWELHDRWFARGGSLPEAELIALAREVGLGDAEVEAARSDPELLRRVKRDFDAAKAAGAPREPTLFVNGRYLSGLRPYQELRAVVVEELGAAPARAGAKKP
jgi:protein-disulfide isomerase